MVPWLFAILGLFLNREFCGLFDNVLFLGSLSSKKQKLTLAKEIHWKGKYKGEEGGLEMVALRAWVDGTSRKAVPGSSPGRHQLLLAKPVSPSPCPRLMFPGESPWGRPPGVTVPSRWLYCGVGGGGNSPKHSWSALPEEEGVDTGQAKTTEVQYIS